MAFDATDFIPAKVDPLTITDPRERLKYLAGFLRDLPEERFDMAYWVSETPICGTVCCIGGWSETLFKGRAAEGCDVYATAGRRLGLKPATAEALFHPTDGVGWLATPRQAAQVIDHLLLTGEVDWGVAS